MSGAWAMWASGGNVMAKADEDKLIEENGKFRQKLELLRVLLQDAADNSESYEIRTFARGVLEKSTQIEGEI